MNEIPVQSLPNGIVFHPKPESKKFKDITGLVYGMLTVLGYAPPKLQTTDLKPIPHWWCKCECGVVKPVQSHALKAGKVKSCGCGSGYEPTHGMTNTKEFRAWSSMKERCLNAKHKYYYRYGGRGVTICARWINSFENFLEDVGPSPKGVHRASLDRVDNNGNYEPGNCRWTDTVTQCRNRSSNRLLTYNGQTKCLSEWGIISGKGENAIRSRLLMGWSIDRAMETPLRIWKRKHLHATH